jgi:hypothetical protein
VICCRFRSRPGGWRGVVDAAAAADFEKLLVARQQHLPFQRISEAVFSVMTLRLYSALFVRALMFPGARQQLVVIDALLSFPQAAQHIVQSSRTICMYGCPTLRTALAFSHCFPPRACEAATRSTALSRGLRYLLEMHNALNELAGRSKVTATKARLCVVVSLMQFVCHRCQASSSALWSICALSELMTASQRSPS